MKIVKMSKYKLKTTLDMALSENYSRMLSLFNYFTEDIPKLLNFNHHTLIWTTDLSEEDAKKFLDKFLEAKIITKYKLTHINGFPLFRKACKYTFINGFSSSFI